MSSSSKKYLLIFLIILLISFLLRIHNLNGFPIFGDEAIYIRWAQQMQQFPELRFVPLSDGKQPLFMWSIIPFLKIFDDPLISGRIVSVLTGVGSSLGIFVLTLLLFNKSLHKSENYSTFKKLFTKIDDDKKTIYAAFLAMLLYSISPFSIFFDRLALADSMLAMFGVWTLIFSLLTVVLVRLDTAIVAGFTLGGAFLTKSPALFFAFLILTTLVLRIFKDKKVYIKDKKLLYILPLFIATYLVSYAMYNILRLGPNFHMLQQRTLDYVYPYNHILSSPLDPLLPFMDRIIRYYWILGPGVLLVLFMLGVYKLYTTNKLALIVLLAWLLVPTLLVAEYSQTMTARYVYFSVPYFFILASASILYTKYLKKVIYFGVFITILLSVKWNLTYHFNYPNLTLPQTEKSGFLQEWTSGIGINQSVEYIENLSVNNPETRILVGTEGHFGTLPQGFEIYFSDNPNVEVIGVGIGLEEIPKELVDRKVQENFVFLLINNDRSTIDPTDSNNESTTLDLVAEYPKVPKEDGNIQTLQLFELVQN